MSDEIYIEQLKKSDSLITNALNKLLMQLDKKAKPLTGEDIAFMVNSTSNRIFVAKKMGTNEIVGMVTLITYRIPFTKKGILEDFVVDENTRGIGVGTKLILHAIQDAKEEGVSYLDFTSRPEREVANKLYERLGFKKRDTNIYRIRF